LSKRNAGIDLQTVTARERLERELGKLGEEIKPSFNLVDQVQWIRFAQTLVTTALPNPNNKIVLVP